LTILERPYLGFSISSGIDANNSLENQTASKVPHSKKEVDMAISVNVPTPLRKLTDNQAEVEIDAASVEELIEGLENAHAGIKEKLLDESGEIRPYVNIFVNDEDIRFLDGKGTELKDGDNVSIVPSIAGGCDR
jgi:molybdopterin synthase sulfur carrier subunit